jgi:hypothetical protein
MVKSTQKADLSLDWQVAGKDLTRASKRLFFQRIKE